jgi:hypothetical protein
MQYHFPEILKTMLSFAALALAGASTVCARHFPRQSSLNGTSLAGSLPSYQHYINASRNDNSPVTLRIDTQDIAGRNNTSPLMYGLMHEVNDFCFYACIQGLLAHTDLGHQPLWRWWHLC